MLHPKGLFGRHRAAQVMVLLLLGCEPQKAQEDPPRWILTEREGRLMFVVESPPSERWIPAELETRGWMEGDVAVIEARPLHPGRHRFTAEALRPVVWRTPTTIESEGSVRFEFTSGARGWAGVTVTAVRIRPDAPRGAGSGRSSP